MPTIEHILIPILSSQADVPEKTRALGGKQPSDSVSDTVTHVSRRGTRAFGQAQSPLTHGLRAGLDTRVLAHTPQDRCTEPQ